MLLLRIRRGYRGLVDGHAGQAASTRFLTVMWMPVVPIDATWLYNPVTGAGHDMKWSGRSVAAAYTRSWGPVVAAISAMAGGVGAWVAAGALAITGWTWSWRFVLDGARKKRRAMNQLALGTGCEPQAMTADYAAAVRASVDDNWLRHGTGGSPSDVARFGTDDPRVAAAAYGVLRMSALALPERRAELEADARRIADGVRELPDPLAHPYRVEVRALPAPRVADRPRAVEPVEEAPAEPESPITALAVARISERLRDELVPIGFRPVEIDARILDVEVAAAFARRSLLQKVAVVHLRVPRGRLPLHANAFGNHTRRADLVVMSRELVPSLGSRLGHSTWRSLVLHLVWSGDELAPGDPALGRDSVTGIILRSATRIDIAGHTARVHAVHLDAVTNALERAIA